MVLEHDQAFPSEDDELPIIYVTEVLVEEPHNEWECPNCTLWNPMQNHFCGACENPAMVVVQQPPPAQVNQQQTSGGRLFTMYDEERRERNEELPAWDRNDVKMMSGTSVAVAVDVTEVIDDAPPGESPWEKKMRRRHRRKGRVCAGVVGGAVIGGVLGCGIGALAGALAGGVAARSFSKRGERKKDERLALSSTIETKI